MKLQNFIDGEFREAQSAQWLDNYNPATGQVYSQIPRSQEADVAAAVAAAKGAFPLWRATSAEERSRWLFRIADAIEKNLAELAATESRDQGKPLWLAKSVDIPRAAANFRFFASEIVHLEGQATDMNGKALNYTLRKPIGVAGLISPWNLPLYLLTWKIAPAIAAGNTVVCKPSELTPFTAYALAKILADLGLPKGVVNIVFGLGPEAGEALVRHPDVPLLSFTGGTLTGQRLAGQAAPLIKKLSLELGGKNANIIFADAPFEKMLETTIRSSFLNQGEICLCGSRILVHKDLAKRFTEAFVQKTKALRVGDPQDEKNFLGALVSEAHLRKVESYLEIARAEKAQILAGDEPLELRAENQSGYFLRPHIIAGVGSDSRLFQEEIFGPVVTITEFNSDEEAIELANKVNYGLSASLWTQDLSRAHRTAQNLDVGTVWVNTWMMRDLRVPFGGQKQSGLGREGGKHSLEFYTESVNVCVSLS